MRSYRRQKSTSAIHGALESHTSRDQKAISVQKVETNRSKWAKRGTFPLSDAPEERITFLWHRGDQPNRFHVTLLPLACKVLARSSHLSVKAFPYKRQTGHNLVTLPFVRFYKAEFVVRVLRGIIRGV